MILCNMQPPQPPLPWTEVFDAFEYGDECIQKLVFANNNVTGSEDCLFVNVYTPVKAIGDFTKLPVMLFIHGGGYLQGSGNGHDPDFLLNSDDVILVS